MTKKILILLGFILAAILSLPFFHAQKDSSVHFAILPHFMIEPNVVKELYSDFEKNYYPGKSSADAIIVISPNHFDRGDQLLESVEPTFEQLCYREDCVHAGSLSNYDIIGNGRGVSEQTQNEDLVVVNANGVARVADHGIGEHFQYLNDFFPKSVIYPLVVNPFSRAGGRMLEDVLPDIIDDFMREGKKVFVIASVDYSHYVDEQWSFIHDRKAIYTTYDDNSILSDYLDLEVDCSMCLRGIQSAARAYDQHPSLVYRDSAATIVGSGVILKKYMNTSRQFWKYDQKKDQSQSGMTIAFFGDVLYDRGVEKLLPTQKRLAQHFSDFYMQGDIKNNPVTDRHRNLHGIDFVGLNSEMPVVRDGQKISDECFFDVSAPHFCGHNRIVEFLSDLGFNLVTLANNHALRDQGAEGFEVTADMYEDYGYSVVGTLGNSHYQANLVETGELRGTNYVWYGFDFTVTTGMLDSYCAMLEVSKSEGYINFVTVHWGQEYQEKPSTSQKFLGRKLVDCGAEVIIGHGPHVVQPVEWYQEKPIVYSLGNFLFDQNFSRETMMGEYVIIDWTEDAIDLVTGEVAAYPFYRE